MITKLSNIVIQGILCTLFLLPNILEVISTEIEGSTISKDETCDTKGKLLMIDILIYIPLTKHFIIP